MSNEEIKKNAIPTKTQSLAPTICYGSCKFCGQTFAIETVDEGDDQEILDKQATRMCLCAEAKEWCKAENSKNKAENNIKELFGANSIITEILVEQLERVSSGDIVKITVDAGDGYKGSLTTTQKGKLKVEKNISKKITREVE